ncbi:MAG: hypothetical protein K9M99_12370 [Candidatus Cloacimonetes bacterium]|nr:hypothetical protein [Candidatus Cloacimonadota bacterium]
MSRKKLLITNIVLFAILFLTISINKDHLRPIFSHQLYGRIITGCLPNFIAAFIISLAMLNALMIKLNKYRHILLYLIPTLIFAILAFEEFVPLWGASTQFDVYDIIASGIGAILSLPAYKLTLKNHVIS